MIRTLTRTVSRNSTTQLDVTFVARIFKRATQTGEQAMTPSSPGPAHGARLRHGHQGAADGTAAYLLPWYAILVLPVLFTAGMTLFDTVDGLFMAHAHKWTFLKPERKIFYNFTVTLLSVLVALTIGVIVLLQLVADEFDVGAVDWIASLDLEYVGFALVATFVGTSVFLRADHTADP